MSVERDGDEEWARRSRRGVDVQLEGKTVVVEMKRSRSWRNWTGTKTRRVLKTRGGMKERQVAPSGQGHRNWTKAQVGSENAFGRGRGGGGERW